MTKKTLAGTYNSGYAVSGATTYVSISSTGYLLGTGLTDAASVPAYRFNNQGHIKSSNDGIYAASAAVGQYVINGSIANTSASINGANTGIYLAATGVIKNYGAIVSLGSPISTGVYMAGSGTLVNGAAGDTTATINAGGYGVRIFSNGTVHNYGAIVTAGHYAIAVGSGGGLVTNGSIADTTATVQGETGAVVASGAGAVSNFGTIFGDGFRAGLSYYGVLLKAGGSVTNGSALEQSAVIKGDDGVSIEGILGHVVNFGTIAGLGGPGKYGVMLKAGGGVSNGNGADTQAVISGYGGVLLYQAGSVTNVGLIRAAGGFGVVNQFGGATVTNLGSIVCGDNYAVALEAGGKVINGSGTRRTARIEGYGGIFTAGYSLVTNFGSIVALANYGVKGSSGRITNGGGSDTTALIEGAGGVQLTGGGAIANHGTILGDYRDGVQINAYASITNGSVDSAKALIEGSTTGVYVASGTIINFGTIRGDGDGYGAGVTGGDITNGALGHATALIAGDFGVYENNQATVTNFGTIAGGGGAAIHFGVSSDVLKVEAGSKFIGQVLGGGGTLDLASGTGTLQGLFTAGNVSVSGAIAATTFTNFGTLEVDSGASFTLTGAGAVSAAQSLVVAGTLSASGVITSAGSLTLTGALAGAGSLALTGGTATIGAGTPISIAHVTMASGATAAFIGNATDAKLWTQTGGTLSVAGGDVVGFSGVGNSFAGTLSGAGAVAFTGGSDSLTGVTLSIASASISGGAKVTLAGTITLAGVLGVTTTDLIVDAAGATLKGGGVLALSNTASNRVYGATAGAALINASDTITGAGLLGNGSMALNNAAGGTINANVATALTIDVGANTISNSGLIEATAAGGLVIQSAITNTGTLGAVGGKLTVNGAVSGAGAVKINGGVADMTSSFVEKVNFTGASGVLELAQGQKYTGTISGFSLSGTTSLDLDDIAFAAGTTKATYAGTGASGTLTVTDGTHTAKIKFAGDYTASTFVLAADGHGGTIIHDPVARHGATGDSPIVSAVLNRFASAAAGLVDARPGASSFGLDPATELQGPLVAADPHGNRAGQEPSVSGRR